MSRQLDRIRLIAIGGVALGVIGCAAAGASPTTTTGPSAAPPTVAPATPTPVPTATPDPPPASLAEPPAATMSVEGGDPVSGSLGSFTWADGGSDSPWLPGARITVASGEPLTIALPGGVPVKDWVAKRVPAGTSDGAGAVRIADGAASPISFPAPGPGSWSVQVVVTFGDGLGSAAYYWTVTVT